MAKKLISYDELTGTLPPVVIQTLDARYYIDPDAAGIPKADLAPAVQTSLGKADTASQPGHTHVKTDLAAAVQTSLGKADTASQPGHVHAQSEVTGLTAALTAKADLVGGVIPQSQIPAVALQDFLGAVGTQAAMLALTGQRGDWCTRTDRGTDFQLIADSPTLLASWRERTYPASPVSSVNGRNGAVTTGADDITDATVTGKALIRAVDAAGARGAIGAAPSASPTFTGTATVPTLVLPTGAGAGKVWTSDPSGQGTWQTPGAGMGDASPTAKGGVKLAGDLGGTADMPTVPNKADKANPVFTGKVTTPELKVTGGTPGEGKVLVSDADGDATWREMARSVVYVPGGSTVLANSATAVMQNNLVGLSVDPSHTLDTDGLTVPTGRYLVACDVVWNAIGSTVRACGVHDGVRSRIVEGSIAATDPYQQFIFYVDVEGPSAKLGFAFAVSSTTASIRTIAAGTNTRMTVIRM